MRYPDAADYSGVRYSDSSYELWFKRKVYQFSSVMVDFECEVSRQGEHGLCGEDLVCVVQDGVEHVVRTLLDVSRKFQRLQQNKVINRLLTEKH